MSDPIVRVYIVGLWLTYIGASSNREALNYIESAFEIEVVNLAFEQDLGFGSDETLTCNFEILEVN